MQQVCRGFLKTGECKFGPQCKFAHISSTGAQQNRTNRQGRRPDEPSAGMSDSLPWPAGQQSQPRQQQNPRRNQKGTGPNARDDRRNGPRKPDQSHRPQKNGAKQSNQQRSVKELYADVKVPGALFDESWKKELPRDNFRFQSICPTEEDINGEEYPEAPENIVHMAYDSTEQYLETHFRLLRADCIIPVRDTIRAYRWGTVDDNEMMIYRHVRPVALLFANIGMVHRVSFIVDGHRVNWRQSKRLIPGTIVCLSTDEFENFRFATVVEREIDSLQDPRDLRVGIQFIHPDPQQDFDPDICYTMIEAMQGYFEAYKHVLKCLQDIDPMTLPFQPQLVGLEHDQNPPEYSTNINHKWHREFLTNSILEFPKIIKGDDPPVRPGHRNQENKPEIIVERDVQPRVIEAVERMLTDEFAVLQGPPGTGKTFLSLLAMHILLSTCRTSDTGPIIVVCQTNHALDQFLEGIMTFEDRIVRMGSRSKSELVMPRTLYNLRMHYRENPVEARNDGVKLSFPVRLFKMKDKLEADMTNLLDELTVEYVPLSKLLELGIITQSQHDSFDSDDWVTSSTEEEEDPTAKSWLQAATYVQDPNDIAFFDDAALKDDIVPEIDEEELQERVEEFMAGTVDDTKIRGSAVNMLRSIVCHVDDSVVGDIEPYLTMKNVQAIPDTKRLGVYKVWLKQYQKTITTKLGALQRIFDTISENIRIELRKNNIAILNTARVIGMTTTAASKYHDLLCLMKPKIMLCEEASETMEAHLISALAPSMKHIILVGDHQQLRPSMSVNDLKDKNIDVSMFERLVTNNFPFTVLDCQRRMRPEIRGLIKPIYRDLTDHRSVCSYDNVRGMTNNLWFLTHDEPDMLGGNNSHVNMHEVAIAAKLAIYLLQQGYMPSEITILAMYAGQRNMIKERLHKSSAHGADKIHVSTVDGFQGEENEIIILSLVRSNTNRSIGFLKTSNRVCVGLSRAKKGMYILGNGKLLMEQSDLWSKVVKILLQGGPPQYKIGNRIKLQCSRHPEMISEVGLEADFDVVREGGCSLPCNGTFPKCRHPCPFPCHTSAHEDMRCNHTCGRMLSCGKHICAGNCGDGCRPCMIC